MSVRDSAKQTARLTFTTVAKAFMVLIIKSSQDQTGKNLSGCGCKSGNILSAIDVLHGLHTHSHYYTTSKILSSSHRDPLIRHDSWFVNARCPAGGSALNIQLEQQVPLSSRFLFFSLPQKTQSQAFMCLFFIIIFVKSAQKREFIERLIIYFYCYFLQRAIAGDLYTYLLQFLWMELGLKRKKKTRRKSK